MQNFDILSLWNIIEETAISTELVVKHTKKVVCEVSPDVAFWEVGIVKQPNGKEIPGLVPHEPGTPFSKPGVGRACITVTWHHYPLNIAQKSEWDKGEIIKRVDWDDAVRVAKYYVVVEDDTSLERPVSLAFEFLKVRNGINIANITLVK